MRWPHFGGDEDLIARHPGDAQSLPYLALVVVHFGGIDVAIAEAKGLLDDPRASASAQLPGAQPEKRDARASRLDGRYHCRCHGRELTTLRLGREPGLGG